MINDWPLPTRAEMERLQDRKWRKFNRKAWRFTGRCLEVAFKIGGCIVLALAFFALAGFFN